MVPSYHAWLDDVRPSPYADQLSLGFRGLRFSRLLEREYRAHLLDDSFELKRIALSVAVVIWLAFALLDLVVVEAPHLWWILAVRLLVLAILAYALLTQQWLWLLAMPLAGYGFAWVGHFVFEKNRPATFDYPLYSLMGDWVMLKDAFTGRIRF